MRAPRKSLTRLIGFLSMFLNSAMVRKLCLLCGMKSSSASFHGEIVSSIKHLIPPAQSHLAIKPAARNRYGCHWAPARRDERAEPRGEYKWRNIGGASGQRGGTFTSRRVASISAPARRRRRRSRFLWAGGWSSRVVGRRPSTGEHLVVFWPEAKRGEVAMAACRRDLYGCKFLMSVQMKKYLKRCA